jgi:hypothetical protein
MTKILNLDKIETKRDKVVILEGVEHVMSTLTVKEYVNQMKKGVEIERLMEDETALSAERVLELSIDALAKVFPTITKEQFENLNIEQLTAIRALVEDQGTDDLESSQVEGEALGKIE